MRPLLRRSRRFRKIRSRHRRRSENTIIDKPSGSVEFRIKFFDAESIRVVGVGHGYEDSVADDGLDGRRRNVSFGIWGLVRLAFLFFFGFLSSTKRRRKKEELTISFDSVACPLAERSVCHRVAT